MLGCTSISFAWKYPCTNECRTTTWKTYDIDVAHTVPVGAKYMRINSKLCDC